jgi:hypothetical protein
MLFCKVTRVFEGQDYIRNHYTGGRIVVAGAGAISHDDLVKVHTHFLVHGHR